MRCLRLFRRKDDNDGLLRGGLPPSFRPSTVMPSVTVNGYVAIPSVGNASTHSGPLVNVSQDAKQHLATTSQDVKRKLAHASPSWFRDMAPVHITCRDWNDGGIFDWYQTQPYTIIGKLELRKERDHFKHEYIVIYLDNGWYHRIERRPIKGANTETISKEGCEAEDSLTPVSDKDLEIIRSETDVEITLEFHPHKLDLYNVIAVAVAIYLDPQTKNYTLQQYNCFFVARSIIALVTRHCLFQEPLMTDLRWDRVTEDAIFNHVFVGDWNNLTAILKKSVSVILDDLLWGIIKVDAGTRIENEEDWDRLREIARKAIDKEVEECSATLVIDEVQRAVTEWIMDATQGTLWHESLEQNLSEPQYTKKYEETATNLLKSVVKPQLQTNLPENMLESLGAILPKRLIHRIPASKLRFLSPDMLARVPTNLLEKLPDDLLEKLPYDAFQDAPTEFWERLPADTFSRMKTAAVLTLPDDLDFVPSELLGVSLQRMRDVLDQRKNHPDWRFALKLLRRLPEEQLAQLDPSYLAMRDSEADVEPGTPVDYQTKEQTPDDSAQTKQRRLTLDYIKSKWNEASFIGLMIQLAPMPILKRVPPNIMDLMPDSSLGLIPTSALDRLPMEYLAKVSTHCFERLPVELLCKVPESLLKKMPRSTVERLPTSFLERVPAELIQKLPQEFLGNMSEDLTDQIREIVQSLAFESEALKQQLLELVKELLRQTLVATPSELPAVIQVSIRADPTKKLPMHEDLQDHILNMNRMHSKMVAQVPLLGMTEERVYDGLRTTKEEIWRVMRLHPSFPGRSRT